MYRRLHKEQKLFSNVDAYITGSIDPGLLIVEGKLADGVSMEKGEAAIWKELDIIKEELMSEEELQKIKNKAESTLIFSESNVLNKAMNLAFFELLGDANRINEEVDLYQEVTRRDIQKAAQQIFKEENCSALYYKAE